MLLMLLKMTGVTALYVLLTLILTRILRNRKPTMGLNCLIGLIYGFCAILSTHFGVDYGHMLLNVRDLGPLSAGLFFSPTAGIVAGLLGGVERYIVGRWFGIGAYTRIACSVSTILAGFVSALMRVKLFNHKKPSPFYAFFMGAVMEVFHMYVVLITHRDDMNMAYYVVQICGGPMIVFTGIGMAVSSIGLKAMAGEWRNPFRRHSKEEIPVSQRFQRWLLVVTTAIFLLNFGFSFAIQTQVALQNAWDTLNKVSDDISDTYDKIALTEEGVQTLARQSALTQARAVAEAVAQSGGMAAVDKAYLEELRTVYGLLSVSLVDGEGRAVTSVGDSPVYAALLKEVLDGSVDSQAVAPSSRRIVAGAHCEGGMVQTVADPAQLMTMLNMDGLNDVMAYFHVSNTGTFDIIRQPGVIMVGAHKDGVLTVEDRVAVLSAPLEAFFEETLFGIPSLCRMRLMDENTLLLTQLPLSEVYANRNAQAFETAFADILLFTVIYVLISFLIQQIVVNNLDMVNASLARITNGDLNEVVRVRNSSEFASLSDDINLTVNVLKGYIEAAEKRIEQELEFARTIQDSALPKNFSFPRDDFSLFATMDPAKEVGGDFYDFFFIDQNRLALVIADVSGKGIPAALFMMRSKTAIRSLAETGSAPSEILFKANNTLCEGNDAEMFVTVWLGIIDLTTGVMRCANAGHEYPALMRAGGDFELYKDKHGLALAAMENMRFREYEIELHPGDRLFVYTDGIPEAIDAQTEAYGTARLVDRLNAMKDQPMQAVLPAVRRDISDFAGDVEQFDDITMLGFVYNGYAEGRTDA